MHNITTEKAKKSSEKKSSLLHKVNLWEPKQYLLDYDNHLTPKVANATNAM